MELKLDRSIIAGLATAALLTAAGCRCAPMITQLEPARVVALPAGLLIPATYVGQQNTGAVEVVNEGGDTATLELAIGLPFTIATPALSLVRGQSETVIVTFAPSAPGPSSRTFHVGELEVQVESEGLSVPECVSPAACVSSAFDFDALACVEPDGTQCETNCVRGGCDRGACIGGFKGCDDGDACPVDGCSETNGCSHVTRTCPAPASVCQVARCDSATGCGLEPVPDGTLCGPDDCEDISTDICLAGQCVQRPRPATGRCANRWIPGSIPGRAGHAMAFDATRGRTILFGGGNTRRPSSATRGNGRANGGRSDSRRRRHRRAPHWSIACEWVSSCSVRVALSACCSRAAPLTLDRRELRFSPRESDRAFPHVASRYGRCLHRARSLPAIDCS